MGNQTNEVDIPYAESLARAIPPVAIRLRRDFGAILSLIEAHAALHQATRPRDDRGRIVATEADYLAVRRLILGVVSAGVGATVAPIVRETVKVVQDLTGGDRDRGVSSAAVASALGLDTYAAWRRLAAASTSGYIENLEDRPRRAGRYVVGDPMPEDKLLLPDPVANLDDAGNRRPDGVCTFAPLSEEVSRDAE